MAEKKKECIEYDVFGKCVKYKEEPDGSLVMEVKRDKACSLEDYNKTKELLMKNKLKIRIHPDNEVLE